MPGRRWTDEARFIFLSNSIPSYETAQEHNMTRSYMADLHERYFKKFPQPDEAKMAAEKKVCELQLIWIYFLLIL